MKQLSLIFVVLFSFSALAEDHSGTTAAEAEAFKARNGLSKEKYEKFLGYLQSACSVQRQPAAPQRSPGVIPQGAVTSQSGATTSAPQSTPSSGTTSSSTAQSSASTGSTASADGASLFQSRCISCHSKPGRPSLTGMESLSISKIQSGEMPQGGSLSASEKAALIAFLSK